MGGPGAGTINLFRSRVGRRVLALFVACALVPVALVAAVSYQQVSRQLEAQAWDHLRRETKSLSVTLYERLLALENTVASVAAAAADAGSDRVRTVSVDTLQALVGDRFERVSLVHPDGRVESLAGSPMERPVLGDRSVAHLESGQTLLLTRPDGDRHEVLMLRDAGEVLVIAAPAPSFLWRMELDPGQHACVVDADLAALHCDRGVLARWSEPLTSGLNSANTGQARVRGAAGAEELLHYKSLFLDARFAAPSWVTVLASDDSDHLLASLRFQKVFPSIVLLSLLFVLLLSLVQIRRFLVPVERLREGTRRVAEQDFGTPVVVPRDDEFGELADSFNRMSTSLEEMFATLERFSELDATILTAARRTDVLDAVTAQLPELMGCDAAALVALPLGGATGSIRVARPPVAYDPAHDVRVLDAATARYANHHDYLQILEDAGELPPGLSALAPIGQGRVLWMPVLVDGRLAAVLACGFRDPDALTERRLLNAQDLSQRLTLALTDALKGEALHRQASFDALTGLPNRHMLNQRLAQAVRDAGADGSGVALLFLDLDRFKAINDSLGHAIGDRFLQRIAERLALQVRDSETVSRFGGDEFVVLIAGEVEPTRERALSLAHLITTAVREPCEIDGRELSTSTSIGISLFPDPAGNATELLKQADIALYHAKRQGKDTWRQYTPDLMDLDGQRLQIESALRDALERELLVLHYQPLLDMDLGRVRGVEALLRWPDCPLGPMGPERFVAVAEESRLITDIGTWVLRTACMQLREWHDAGLTHLHMCVNLSPRQFRNPDLPAEITRVVEETGISPAHLELEVTETTLMDDIRQAAVVLRRLRGIGVGVSIDDFGTGHSSLEYLAHLPASTFKVDRSFVSRLPAQREVVVIVETLIDLAHRLGMSVVAEGVETREQYEFLHARGCNLLQGYHYAEPMSAEAFRAWHRVRPIDGDAGLRRAP